MSSNVCEKQSWAVAFQPAHGAGTEEAVRQLLPSDSIRIPCESTEAVCEAVHLGHARYGVIPVEKSSEGSLHRAYDLILKFHLTIVGEAEDRTEGRSVMRYVAISKPMEMVRSQAVDYKRSIVFRILDAPGALRDALQAFEERNVSVTHWESRTTHDSPFESVVYLDVDGRADFDAMYSAVEEVRSQALSLRVLGMYPKAAASSFGNW